MDLKDDSATVEKLFVLINFITDGMVCHPKALGDLDSGLPQAAKDAINKRDGAT